MCLGDFSVKIATSLLVKTHPSDMLNVVSVNPDTHRKPYQQVLKSRSCYSTMTGIKPLMKRQKNFALTRVCSSGNRWIASVHQANKNYCGIWIAIDRARKRFISWVWAAVIPWPDDSCGSDSGQKYRMPEDRLLDSRSALCAGRDAKVIKSGDQYSWGL